MTINTVWIYPEETFQLFDILPELAVGHGNILDQIEKETKAATTLNPAITQRDTRGGTEHKIGQKLYWKKKME